MDSNEEFQFKPITKGLGFQKKSEDSSASQGSQSVSAQSVSRMISSLPSLDFAEKKATPPQPAPASASLLHTPLPRTGEIATPNMGPIPGIPARDSKKLARSPSPEPPSQPAPSKPSASRFPGFGSLKKSATPVITTSAATITPKVQPARPEAPSSAPLQPAIRVPADVQAQKSSIPETVSVGEQRLVETPFNFLAGLFDAFVVMGLTCIFAVALLIVTGTDLGLVMSNAQSDVATQFGISLLVVAVYALYMIVARCFCGFTLGEWAFDMQLGLPHEQKSAWYPLAVAWRFLVVILTGFITLPLLSIIMKRDLTARLTGIRLYRQI